MKYYRVCAKINLDVIGENLNIIKSGIPSGVKVLAVVKADAYGHGAVTVAQYLSGKVDMFGVASLEEALELRNHGISEPVLVLGYTSPSDYKTIAENDITVTIYDSSDAEKLSETALSLGKTAKLHIKTDTGMSRLGFQTNEKSAADICYISQLPNIEIEGIFSHYATADEDDKTEAYRQKERFEKFIAILEKNGLKIPVKHMSNSAGTKDMDSFYDMVRCGITLYGMPPSGVCDEKYPVKPAMELLSRVICVKELEKGRRISYGGTYITEKNMKVATVSVGYADGYPRLLSNKGEVIIRGKRCPVLGKVCMDQLMVDVSGVEDVCVEDVVTVVGKSGGESIPVEEVASLAGTVNYELVCGISRRVPRLYIKNGKEYKTVTYLGEKNH